MFFLYFCICTESRLVFSGMTSSLELIKLLSLIAKKGTSFRQDNPININEAVSTISIEFATYQALFEKLKGMILKKFTNIKVAINVLPINIKYLLITKKGYEKDRNLAIIL